MIAIPEAWPRLQHRLCRSRPGYRVATAALALMASVAMAPAHAKPYTVAFIGDQGVDDSARAVLELIAQQEVDLLLLQGDLGYGRDAASEWIANIEGALDPELPVLFTVGNHENYQWPVYQRWLLDRLERTPQLACRGAPGVKAHCVFRDLSIVQTAPGVHEVEGVSPDDNYAGYIADELSGDQSIWRVCSWHKNQRDMQVGGKGDSVGWAVYDACLAAGAFIATAHEHSWSRTYLMKDFRSKAVAHRKPHLELEHGRSFAFVSGLGGQGIRPQKHGGDWWASVYSATQSATYGALFCTFNDSQASCEFRDIAGGVVDTFSLQSRIVPGEPTPQADASTVSPLVAGAAPATGRGGALGRSGLFALLLFCTVRLMQRIRARRGRW